MAAVDYLHDDYLFTALDSELTDHRDWIACDSDLALRLFAPRLGPTSTLLLHHLCRQVRSSLYPVQATVLASLFGVAPRQLGYTLGRLHLFGMLIQEPQAQCFQVRMGMPGLPRRWREDLPHALAHLVTAEFDPPTKEHDYALR